MDTLHDDQYEILIIYLFILIQWEKFPAKFVEKIKTYFLCWKGSPPQKKSCPLRDKVEKYCRAGRHKWKYGVEKKNQLDATEWFIAFIICSTCFGHFYAHHQELETICMLLPPMMCEALFAGCWRSGTGHRAMRSGWGMLLKQRAPSRTHSRLLCTWPPTSNQGIAHHKR